MFYEQPFHLGADRPEADPGVILMEIAKTLIPLKQTDSSLMLTWVRVRSKAESLDASQIRL